MVQIQRVAATTAQKAKGSASIQRFRSWWCLHLVCTGSLHAFRNILFGTITSEIISGSREQQLITANRFVHINCLLRLLQRFQISARKSSCWSTIVVDVISTGQAFAFKRSVAVCRMYELCSMQSGTCLSVAKPKLFQIMFELTKPAAAALTMQSVTCRCPLSSGSKLL